MPTLKLSNPFRRQNATAALHERSADLRARISASAQQAPVYVEQVERAGLTGDVLAASGIDHRDGTVSYADATGKVVRRPMARWVAFNAQQMHSHVQSEMARRQTAEASNLSSDDHAAWLARVRRELRADAVHVLTFRSDRAHEAAQAIRTGTEPATQALREQSDADLRALAPLFEAAVDLYQQRTDEENAVCDAARDDGWPGAAPEGSGPEWQAWFRRKEDWRERTGVAAAEEASGDAGTALFEIECQIADLPAASLAGLKLKARVAQRNEDLGQEWVAGLGAGLVRDILALEEPQAVQPTVEVQSLTDRIDFTSASMNDLQAIHDTATLLGDVAYAVCWQGRCQASTELNSLGARYNAAGELMHWLGEALTDVQSAAVREARSRRPTAPLDQETRLTIVAQATVEAGDTNETAAFISDLAIWLAEDAKG